MSNNPLLNHAQLWGYWNSDAWNGDEFNGAGKNLPVSPMQFARDAAVRAPSRSLRTPNGVKAGAQKLEEQDHERTE